MHRGCIQEAKQLSVSNMEETDTNHTPVFSEPTSTEDEDILEAEDEEVSSDPEGEPVPI